MVNLTNSTLSDLSIESLLGTAYQYATFGSVSAFTNIFVLLVIASNKNKLKKFAFMFTLSIGDTISGLSLLLTGIIRIFRIHSNIVSNLVHPSFCMVTITQLHILGSLLPPVMLFFMGVERFLALWFFAWYHNKWTENLFSLCTKCAFVSTIISLSVGYIVTFVQSDEHLIPLDCSTPAVVGNNYLVYIYLLGGCGGSIACVPTFGSLIFFFKRKKCLQQQGSTSLGDMKKTVQKNLKITNILFVLALLDLCMVSLPNIMELLIIYKVLSFPMLANWLQQLICLRGSLNVFIFFFTNEEFRNIVQKMFASKKPRKVFPINANAQNHVTYF